VATAYKVDHAAQLAIYWCCKTCGCQTCVLLKDMQRIQENCHMLLLLLHVLALPMPRACKLQRAYSCAIL
jgi:hypothetical protein